MQYDLVVRNVTKLYKSKTTQKVALDDISFQIESGQFFALLGPNGAGKTTLIEIISGINRKTSGEILVCGHDIDKNLMKAKYSIGVVPQELVIDPFFTVREALIFYAHYYNVRDAKKRADELLEVMELTPQQHYNPRQISGGMKRRLLIAKALIHKPKLVILDEPTAGVDIELRVKLWDYFKYLNEQEKTTIMITTHYLEEAEKLCNQLVIIKNGKVLYNGGKADLLQNFGVKKLLLSIDNLTPKLLETLNEKLKNINSSLIAQHSSYLEEEDYQSHQNNITINIPENVLGSPAVKLNDIISVIINHATILDINLDNAKLDDVFIKMVNIK